ncbi:hypothetical protein [Caballeronia sp. AZ10_KS36]|uniref:hypothetical protein n=1 Tax=Caballeronia sp. AZ10_KS36 TaxID=2921757 RepID=UPI002028F880|nr:hypothetical protein [Caballeronia sp. AZ10_KS36]
MEIKSILEDKKVSAKSVLIEISIADYLTLAKQIYKKNNLQRKRVRSSKTVYSLLKNDILEGCVIPPVVLAYTKPAGTLEQDLPRALKQDSANFVLLDGLQRSLTLMEIEAETSDRPIIQERFLQTKIRCEIYEGINKLGILYRMLTLNTGQTPMSVRHQVEIMYQDFLDVEVDGITLVRESDARRARQAVRKGAPSATGQRQGKPSSSQQYRERRNFADAKVTMLQHYRCFEELPPRSPAPKCAE